MVNSKVNKNTQVNLNPFHLISFKLHCVQKMKKNALKPLIFRVIDPVDGKYILIFIYAT